MYQGIIPIFVSNFDVHYVCQILQELSGNELKNEKIVGIHNKQGHTKNIL